MAMPYQLALLSKKSIVDVKGAQRNTYATLQYTSIKIFISPLSMLYLQNVLFIHLRECVFYIIII